MNRTVRILLAIAFFFAIVVAGVGAPAWAARLNAGVASPDSGLNQSSLLVRRPQGTVNTSPICIQTILAGRFTVGSIGTWILPNVAGGKIYTACVVKPIDLPTRVLGTTLTYPIKLVVSSGDTLGVDERVCFPVAPGQIGAAYYWDSKGWVKTEAIQGGQACVTVPLSAPNPSYAWFVRPY